jgi:hypothetical protein
MPGFTRRAILQSSVAPLLLTRHLFAQEPGERPPAAPAEVRVLNPRERVPLAWIIDDSTCLVNLIRFAIPQLAATFPDRYRQDWRSMPYEIPDAFVRRFAEWAQREGVKGKYSVVPFPACVGRLDTELPGWTPKQVSESIDLVRREIAPNWDIHPEMITHTRIIDLKTGHPVPSRDAASMENWDWCAGRSADEIGSYIAYALQILKNVGLHCDGITTPGGFGKGALPELSRGVFQAVRSVYGGELPHYFRNLFDKGSDSVAPRVEFASRLTTSTPECVVSIYACTGDWTGNWDCSLKPDVDRFISPDLSTGRVVDVIERGEPAAMLSHWTGIYYNGQELGFRAMQEVVRRIKTRYKQVAWMKLAELSRYWAARELTTIHAPSAGRLRLKAPYACPDFTLSWRTSSPPALVSSGKVTPLREVRNWQELEPGAWRREGDRINLCISLPKGEIEIQSKI